MADKPEQTPNIYALLIGIDGYKPNRLYNDLKGCVGDINLVASYLLKTVKIPSERIFRLTSPNPKVAQTIATKDPEPTYANIVAQFKAITELAQPGEQVYIYYAGHGGRATTIYPELKGADQEDEGIVPSDISAGGRYLLDVELAMVLKRMTDKGLIVTLIMDSCHSGGVTRGDGAIRSGEETDKTPPNQESLVAPLEELSKNWKTLTEGVDGDIAWVPPIKNYLLLAACRPNEVACEYPFDGKEQHGALTYWLIQTLATSSTALSFNKLYDRVCAQIQSKFPQQLPMLIGDGTRAVFGNDRLPPQYSVTVINVDAKQKQITLNAGLAQGLSSGTRFAIYPLNATDFSNRQQQLAIVEIVEVQASTSVARVLEPQEGGIKVTEESKIELGAPAVLVAAPVALVRRVLLLDNKEAGDKEHQLPPELVDKQQEALEKVRQALTGNGWVVEVKAGDELKSDYQVAVGRDSEYEISSETPFKNLGTPLQIDASDAAIGVVNRLVHLTKYQAVQTLDNPSSELAKHVECELVDENRQPFKEPSNIVLKQGKIVFLRVKNTDSQPLNIAVLDLDSTWAISQYRIYGIEDIFFTLADEQEIYLKMRAALPAGDDDKPAKETLKLFATRGIANFEWLTLPALDVNMGQRKGNLEEKLNKKAEERAARGKSTNISPLNNLLSIIGADVDKAPSPESARAMVYEPDPNADWLTKQVTFTIAR
ncbi:MULTISPECIES: caspase family protein [unclassified Microcoleus]|uniref:caspase family protein n=1 Tax=unclassified Microcoleus TaxID=2642155 RepID=UPI002FD622EC